MEPVAEIKSKLDLVEYIGRGVTLQKAGRNYRGLCPFHAEKTPSFYVFPDRGTWRCFGSCGEGGDLFTFVQKQGNLDFRGALVQLAREAGVELSPQGAEKRGRIERLGSLVSVAVDYYQRCLRDDEGEAARAYLLERRGLSQETVETFMLGWAPDAWRGLRDYLAGRGYDEREMVAAGLLVENEGGREPYDRFRGRVIVPIRDERGIFLGMGGRGLHGEEPKYLNSPQSELFDKGRTLFGLNLAGEAIKASGTVVVVEGYMDVMGPWQAGFRNVVATMGTSLTEGHVAMLKRYAKRIVLAMDPDAAGAAAAERAGGLLLGLESPEEMARSAHSAERVLGGSDLELRVAVLPPGKDPDEVAREDPAGWERAISEALPFPEFLLRRLMGPTPPDSLIDVRHLLDRMKPVINSVSDPVERARYIQRVARFLRVDEGAVLERVKRAAPGRIARRETASRAEPPTLEEMLLAFLFRHPELRKETRMLPPDLFNNGANRALFIGWLAGEEPNALPADDPLGAHARKIEGLRIPPLTPQDARRAVSRKVEEILRDRLIQRQATVTEDLQNAENRLGTKRVAQLSAEAWQGQVPDDDVSDIAQTVIEELELGLSIHRHEATDLY